MKKPEKKSSSSTFQYLYASTPINDSTVISEGYDHTDHCVCKKEEHYQTILEITFYLFS